MWLVRTSGTVSSRLHQKRVRNISTWCPWWAPCPPWPPLASPWREGSASASAAPAISRCVVCSWWLVIARCPMGRSSHLEPQHLIVQDIGLRSEEHTSELQSLLRISYAVFCLKKKTHNNK